MKKTLKSALTLALVALTGLSLLGCAAWDGLATFVTVAGRSMETTDSLDDVGDADLADTNTGELDEVTPLAFSLSETTLTNAEKIRRIVELREEIKSTHAALLTQRATVKTAFQEMKTAVTAFRDAGFTLTEEQRVRLSELKTELRSINDELRASVGQAYRKMADLRGKYDLAHVDLVLSVHEDVAVVLAMRLEKLTRIEAIFAEVSGMVTPEE